MTGKAIYKNVLGKSRAELKQKLKAAQAENAKVDIIYAYVTTQAQRDAANAMGNILQGK